MSSNRIPIPLTDISVSGEQFLRLITPLLRVDKSTKEFGINEDRAAILAGLITLEIRDIRTLPNTHGILDILRSFNQNVTEKTGRIIFPQLTHLKFGRLYAEDVWPPAAYNGSPHEDSRYNPGDFLLTSEALHFQMRPTSICIDWPLLWRYVIPREYDCHHIEGVSSILEDFAQANKVTIHAPLDHLGQIDGYFHHNGLPQPFQLIVDVNARENEDADVLVNSLDEVNIIEEIGGDNYYPNFIMPNRDDYPYEDLRLGTLIKRVPGQESQWTCGCYLL